MSLNHSQVLIVEDSEEMLWSMANVLENAGFNVDAVTTGTEAIEIVKGSPHIRIMILNYLLPDRSGLSVLEYVKTNGCNIEVIGISALRDISDSFMNAGAFAFLEKPFDIRELVRLCTQALKVENALEGAVS